MTNTTARIRTLVWAFAIGAVTLTAAGVVSLRAQVPPGAVNPFTPVLAKLDQILAILTTTPPGSGPVVLSTPFVWKGEADIVGCHVVNVGTETIRVGRRWVDEDGATILGYFDEDLEPGHGIAHFNGIFATFNLRCEFTLLKGTAAAVRANMVVANTDIKHPLVSVDAR